MPSVFRLGLTGGIGCGKSTVAGLMASFGACIIDADAISRQLTAAGGDAIPLIVRTFGPSFIDTGGALNRETMRNLVYSDVNAKSQLESIIHPLVRRDIQSQTEKARLRHCKVVVFDIPLLIESPHWREKMDHILVIDSTPEVQIKRVMARSGMTTLQVEKIIASQASRQLRLRAADTVICNITSSLSQIEAEVKNMATRFGLS